VRELSGTIKFDTSFRASTRDTVIIPVTAATYRVDISDVPSTCGIRDGSAQAIVVPPDANTSLIRFFLNCAPALTVAAYVDGFARDSDFVVTVRDSTGKEQASVLAANDTIRLTGLPAGRYEVFLRHLADNCVPINDGGARIPVEIRPSGGAFASFRIVCSDSRRQPRIVSLAGSSTGNSIGYVVRVTDSDRDVEQTFVDVTDCQQRSVLPDGGKRRNGMSTQPEVISRDTAVIIGAYDLGVPEATLVGRCLGVWIADSRGNTSPMTEIPLRPASTTSRPVVSTFTARVVGVTAIRAEATMRDPENDLVGTFVVYLVRDGVLTQADGQMDRVVNKPAGVLGTSIPELALNIGYGNWNDYLGAILYAVDRAGNVTRIQTVVQLP
jgi:hypothetical protein